MKLSKHRKRYLKLNGITPNVQRTIKNATQSSVNFMQSLVEERAKSFFMNFLQITSEANHIQSTFRNFMVQRIIPLQKRIRFAHQRR